MNLANRLNSFSWDYVVCVLCAYLRVFSSHTGDSKIEKGKKRKGGDKRWGRKERMRNRREKSCGRKKWRRTDRGRGNDERGK